jgi:hypothetical protein
VIDLRTSIRRGDRVRYGVALAIVVVLAFGVVLLVRSPRYLCKGVGISAAISDEPIQTYPSAEAAVVAFVRGNPLRFTPDPVPTDGWHADGSRWVRDLPNGSRYELTVLQQADGGWIAAGSFSICNQA